MKLLFVGLPEAGKTTFIAAFWHTLQFSDQPCAIKQLTMPDDQRYLNLLSKAWLECRPVPRTTLGAEQQVQLRISLADGENPVDLCVPDLSGESFRAQWETRQSTNGYLSLCREAVGALLFIHPDNVQGARTIADADELLREMGDTKTQDPPPAEPEEWHASRSPTQVKLVDLLQVLDRSAVNPPLRLSIVLSAWDRIEAEGLTPAEWLRERMPLLHQYLHVNPERFNPRVYGVSAQGGDLKNEAQVERMRSFINAAERIRVTGDGAAPHDITAPVRHAMG